MRTLSFVTYYPSEHGWGLGPAAFELGSAYLRSDPLERLGGPVLADLAEQTNETAHLGILQGNEVLVLCRKDPPGRFCTFVTTVGVRLPAHLTAMGRGILMELPKSQLRALYPLQAPLVRRTDKGFVLRADLERELEQARAMEYVVDEGMTTLGITCIGVPVFSHENRPLAGMSISFISVHHGPQEWHELASYVRQAAERLSRVLGWKGEAPETMESWAEPRLPAGVAR